MVWTFLKKSINNYTYQDSIKCWSSSTPLNMTQNSHTSVMTQLFFDNLEVKAIKSINLYAWKYHDGIPVASTHGVIHPYQHGSNHLVEGNIIVTSCSPNHLSTDCWLAVHHLSTICPLTVDHSSTLHDRCRPFVNLLTNCRQSADQQSVDRWFWGLIVNITLVEYYTIQFR